MSSPRCIHEWIEAQAARAPDAVALVFEERRLTYRELDRRSNQLAHALVRRGAGPETLVGVCLKRSPELLVAMLGILKSGAAYVPLDPSFPRRRLEAMLADSRIGSVVTDSALAASLIPPTAGPYLLDREAGDLASEDPASPGPRAAPENPAYVIYTSGSTGNPKGVVIEHRNVANFVTAMDAVIGTGPGVWLAVTSISFDISVLELLWTLARGFTVVIAGDGAAQAQGGRYSIAALMREHAVTHLQCTPSLARMLAADPESLREMARLNRLLIGGEAVPAALMERLLPVVGGEIHNVYGPTETTVWSTSFRIEALDGASGTMPIGRPIANTFVYILDDRFEPVPPGEAGELFLGGDGVVRGYLGRPDLTAERFLPDPFQSAGRMYRTGDLARFRSDGVIEFLGRLDHQVKIRGFRIELGEIEGALERYPGVRQAVVHAANDPSGEKRLIAYLVLDAATAATPVELRRHLAESLPAYMIPSSFVALTVIPLTANGKVDRAALPPPQGIEMREPAVYAAPEMELETAIASIWSEALGIERVGLHDNFFDLGAHSLLVAEVHIQLKQSLEREFPLLDLFEHPTVHTLARKLSGAPESAAPESSRGVARREAVRLRDRRARTGSR